MWKSGGEREMEETENRTENVNDKERKTPEHGKR